MTKKDIEIDSILIDIEVYVERAKVLTEDVQQGYFEQNIKDMSDAWRIMPPYYNHSKVKVDIVNETLFTLTKQIVELRNLLCEKEGEHSGGKD